MTEEIDGWMDSYVHHGPTLCELWSKNSYGCGAAVADICFDQSWQNLDQFPSQRPWLGQRALCVMYEFGTGGYGVRGFAGVLWVFCLVQCFWPVPSDHRLSDIRRF